MKMIAIFALLLTTICTVSGEDRVVLTELFTATWCATCPYADAALDSLALQLGEDSLAVLQYHVADAYETSETTARAEYYLNPIQLPYAWFDGTTSVHVVSSVPDAYSKYRDRINGRLAVPSPLTIRSVVILDDTSGEVSSKITVVDAFTDEALRFYAVLYESELDEYNYVVRDMLPTEELSISSPGDSVEVLQTFSIDTLWNSENMGMVVFVQSDSTKQVLQSERIERLPTRVEGDRLVTVEDEMSVRIQPNPFSNSVQFFISSSGQPAAEVRIYDSSGREVRTITTGQFALPGYSLRWDGRDSTGKEVASGVYYVRLVVPAGRSVHKVVCIR